MSYEFCENQSFRCLLIFSQKKRSLVEFRKYILKIKTQKHLHQWNFHYYHL